MIGGDKRDRTADLLHAMQALSQLSYTPNGYKQYTRKRRYIRDAEGACQSFFLIDLRCKSAD
jgi:hypothetical protein